MKHGTLVISLDFELMWGMIDKDSPDNYGRSNVAQVRSVVHRMVELFEKYQVSATFATVGMQMLDGSQAVDEVMPDAKPSYVVMSLSPYNNGYYKQIKEQDQDLYFAPDLVEYLKGFSFIEIGTHTFCHYYCYEKGQTIEQFEADLKTALAVAKNKGIKMNSIVFPRNQVSKEYLSVCAKYGIETYRGNAEIFFTKPKNSIEMWRNRLGRLVDSYVKIGGNTSYSPDSVDSDECPLNIKASRFFRPYSRKLALLEPLKLRRIKSEILYAAQHNEIYHLWWHPHNFGSNMEKNLSNLEEVLKSYAKCREEYGMASMTMEEIGKLIKNG